MTRGSPRSGVTLVELVVTLFVLSISASVVALAFQRVDGTRVEDDMATRIAAARRRAIASRTPVSISWRTESGSVAATAYPDGTVIADSVLPVRRLTGRTREQ